MPDRMPAQPPASYPPAPPRYPAARRLDLVDEVAGLRVADPYRWLEDADADETRAWSDAQDELWERERAGLPARAAFAPRIAELLAVGSVGGPVHRGGRRFSTRRSPEQEHAVLLVTEDGRERVLVDPVALDPSGTTTLDAWQPSEEGDLIAHQLSEGGTEESSLRVLDVATGEVVDGPIDRARYSPVAWLPGGAAFYYVRRLAPGLVPVGEEQYHRRVWLHRVGSSTDDDVEVFGADQPKTNYHGVSVSRDGRWLVVSTQTGTAPRNDVWIADLEASGPAAPQLRVVAQGLDAQTGAWVGRDGRLYVHTDLDAPRGRLAVTSPDDPGPASWRDLLPEHPEAVLDDVAVLDGPELPRPVLLAGWTHHAVSGVTVHDLATGERTGEVELPGLGSIGGLLERPEGGHEAWFGYTDTVTPSSVLRYDARDGSVVVEARAPGSADVPDVAVRQVTYGSKDGTTVRMFVLARADLVPADPQERPERPRPAVLYGYGGFGISLTPGYSAATLAWIESGGVWAVANLRGGGEEGEDWHRAGMLGAKQNVFDDFAAAAAHLVDEGWTTRAQLGIYGGSNGGLLVGAALTQDPGLAAAVVCSAPLLDMVRYEEFGLGATWNVEYGSAADPEQVGWLHAYSPYHAVRDGSPYPAVLFTVFDGDTRVDPLHARKLAAALQHATSSDRPVLVRREKGVGHGARAVSRTVELSADQLAFLARWTGGPDGPGEPDGSDG